jgi:predicted dinucleotide-binding enzyme
MKIAVLGTGSAGRTLAVAFASRGHQVVVGTRDVATTLARTEPEGSESVAEWAAEHRDVRLVPYAEAGAHGEVLVNATSGAGSLAALEAAAVAEGTVVLDVSNPLDFSAGFPPTLSVANTDSVGEQLQRAFPAVRVVKTLNTVNARVMVEPALVPGEHHIFVAGEDDDAKRLAVALLGELGWPSARVIDLGGIRAARSTEMYLPLWLSLMGAVGSPLFNVQVVRG